MPLSPHFLISASTFGANGRGKNGKKVKVKKITQLHWRKGRRHRGNLSDFMAILINNIALHSFNATV